jgi:hypothetical protein
MITNERELRIALQAVLVTILALSESWGCALVVALTMLPWKPIYAVGCYLAQPLVDWRLQKVHAPKGGGIAHIEKELDALLGDARGPASSSVPLLARHSESRPVGRVGAMNANLAAKPQSPNAPQSAQPLAATLAIPPAIQTHVRSLPQGVFHNMDLELEEVKFHGDTADAYVRFKSSSVSGLVIRQHYALRKSGDEWEVESRQPANGGAIHPPQIQLPNNRLMSTP